MDKRLTQTLWTLMISACLVTAATALADAQGTVDAEGMVQRGRSLMLRGRIDDAAVQFQKIIAARPEFVPAYVNLGVAYRRKGRFDQAIAVLDKANTLDPENLAVHSTLGAVYLDAGKLDDAVDEYRTAAEIDPGNADAFANLGLALARQGEFKKAFTYLKKSLSLNPNAPAARKNLGYAYARAKLWPEAIDELLQARAIDALNPGVEEMLVTVLHEAFADPNAAVRIKPRGPRYHYDRAYALAAQDKWSEALDVIGEGIALNGPEGALLKAKGFIAMRLDKLGVAETAYRTCIEKNAADWDCYKSLAMVYLRMERPKKGLEAAARAAEINPDVISVQAVLGVAYAENDAKEKALTAFQRAVALGGDSSLLYFNLATTDFLLKKYDAAWEHVRIAEHLGHPKARELINLLNNVCPEPEWP